MSIAPIDHQRFVASGEKMTAYPMAPVEPHRITSEQPFHPGNEIYSRSFDDQMKMIAHQAIGMHLPAGLRAGLAEYLEETVSVGVVAKDWLSPVASVHEMIKGAFVFDSDLAGHDLTCRKSPSGRQS